MKKKETRWFMKDDLPICEGALEKMFGLPQGWQEVQFVLSKTQVNRPHAIRVDADAHWCDSCYRHHLWCRTTELENNLRGTPVHRDGGLALADFFHAELDENPRKAVYDLKFWLECYYR